MFFKIAFLLCGIFLFCEARRNCTRAVGRVICKASPAHQKNASIEMLDEDVLIDDPMNATRTDENGKFEVYGCASDIIGDPDPYIKVRTQCNSKEEKIIKTKVMQIFVPKVADFGDIILDK
uniref:Transthyretin-like protein 46 n=1 Tax=Romanomermis culicivorax TaxID=13658 RepID=A0A915JFU2_ROMCU